MFLLVQCTPDSHAEWVCLWRVFRLLLPLSGWVTRQRSHGARLVKEDDRVELAIQPGLGVVRETLCLWSLHSQMHTS